MTTPRISPIESVGEALRVVAHLDAVMEKLLAVIDEETALVRAGKLNQSLTLASAKAELALYYVTEAERLKLSPKFLTGAAPDLAKAVQSKHSAFQTALQLNLTVLATAHAVSEGIIRGVSDDLARKRAPTTYGASGRAAALSPRAAQPLAVSRAL